jgi:hypothetical protein
VTAIHRALSWTADEVLEAVAEGAGIDAAAVASAVDQWISDVRAHAGDAETD